MSYHVLTGSGVEGEEGGGGCHGGGERVQGVGVRHRHRKQHRPHRRVIRKGHGRRKVRNGRVVSWTISIVVY